MWPESRVTGDLGSTGTTTVLRDQSAESRSSSESSQQKKLGDRFKKMSTNILPVAKLETSESTSRPEGFFCHQSSAILYDFTNLL